MCSLFFFIFFSKIFSVNIAEFKLVSLSISCGISIFSSNVLWRGVVRVLYNYIVFISSVGFSNLMFHWKLRACDKIVAFNKSGIVVKVDFLGALESKGNSLAFWLMFVFFSNL
jgi:hypothetical protein